jgi:4-alpha-glucanotransferase
MSTTQLYGLRSGGNWGIGDFGDLARLCRAAGALGAAAVGINPLHALFAAEPRHFSPYSPSSRSWLAYLYLDVTQIPGFAEDAAVRALAPGDMVAAARGADLVDYAAVAALKRPVIEALYRRFRTRERGSGSTLGSAFREFRREGGEALAAFATFEALHEHFTEAGGPFSWHAWPPAMRGPGQRRMDVPRFRAARCARATITRAGCCRSSTLPGPGGGRSGKWPE